MAFTFWDAHGILLIDYLEKDLTINSKRYVVQFKEGNLKKKQLHMKKQKVFFHQDNAANFTCSKISKKCSHERDLRPIVQVNITKASKCYGTVGMTVSLWNETILIDEVESYQKVPFKLVFLRIFLLMS